MRVAALVAVVVAVLTGCGGDGGSGGYSAADLGHEGIVQDRDADGDVDVDDVCEEWSLSLDMFGDADEVEAAIRSGGGMLDMLSDDDRAQYDGMVDSLMTMVEGCGE